MATPQALELNFDFDDRGTEKKVANTTKNLMMHILEEAGFDGQWEVRDSRRIRKKGRERFRAIRVESRAGRMGIRVWCKPKGNDTCFEYSLIPPAGVDLREAFEVLKRVNGVTLKVQEPGIVPMAVEDGAAADGVPTNAETVVDAEVVEKEGDTRTPDEDCVVPYGDVSEFPSLITYLGEEGDSAIDRALISIGFVAVNGYAKKAEAFDSMVKNMGLKELSRIRGVSLDETIRILTSAMKDSREYIRRVRHSSKSRKSGSDGILGFKITGKGQERLEKIRSSYGPEVERRLGVGWRSEEPPVVDSGVIKSEVSSAVLPDAIARIKDLVASYEEAARQVSEHDQVLKPIEDGVRALGEEIADLDRSEETLKKKIEELQAEISAIESKRSGLKSDLEKKSSEKREWEALRQPYAKEKARVESILSGLGVIK